MQCWQWREDIILGGQLAPTVLSFCPSNVIFGSDIPLSAKLSTVIRNGIWAWPPARSTTMLDIQASLSQVLPSTLPDSFV